MANIQEIDKAIASHSMWKAHLRKAIEHKELDIPIEKIRDDHECAFGQWLFGGGFSTQDIHSVHFETVKELHAQFHKETAHIAELAMKGRSAEAEAFMAPNSEYTALSARLTSAMMAWKKVSK